MSAAGEEEDLSIQTVAAPSLAVAGKLQRPGPACGTRAVRPLAPTERLLDRARAEAESGECGSEAGREALVEPQGDASGSALEGEETDSEDEEDSPEEDPSATGEFHPAGSTRPAVLDACRSGCRV